MMKMRLFPVRLCKLVLVGSIVFSPAISQAKGNDDQNLIILLNDSASALEDSNPALSTKLTRLADAKEKEWEYNNAHKDAPPVVITDKDVPILQDEINCLKEAALEIKPSYPVIAQSLKKMANGINRSIEIANEK